jgi:hypothetical protein
MWIVRETEIIGASPIGLGRGIAAGGGGWKEVDGRLEI